jgi:hypothetical protein
MSRRFRAFPPRCLALGSPVHRDAKRGMSSSPVKNADQAAIGR